MHAVQSHHLEFVSWLASIDKDCMKRRNRNKHSALHFSAANGNIEVASVLLKLLNSSDKKSLISWPDNNGVTVFFCSCLKSCFELSK